MTIIITTVMIIMIIIIVIAMFIILSIHVNSVGHDEVWIVDHCGTLRVKSHPIETVNEYFRLLIGKCLITLSYRDRKRICCF